MSDSSSNSSKGMGATFSLAGIIGTAVGFFSNASLTGWAGFGKALLIGSGTSIGASLVGGVGWSSCWQLLWS
ncbi:MAG: hypothetical protein OXT65_03985 [Alphaproteobacteria bacterium]|nr:hypothetical protein [Alphaproteobacteria bacterium]